MEIFFSHFGLHELIMFINILGQGSQVSREDWKMLILTCDHLNNKIEIKSKNINNLLTYTFESNRYFGTAILYETMYVCFVCCLLFDVFV